MRGQTYRADFIAVPERSFVDNSTVRQGARERLTIQGKPLKLSATPSQPPILYSKPPARPPPPPRPRPPPPTPPPTPQPRDGYGRRTPSARTNVSRGG